MSKRKRGRHRPGGRVTPRGTRPQTSARPRDWGTSNPHLESGPGTPLGSLDAGADADADAGVEALDEELAAALRESSPFGLAWYVSGLAEAMTRRQADELAQLLPSSLGGRRDLGVSGDEPPELAEFVESLAPVDLPHVAATVRALVAMIPDEHTRRRLAKHVAARPVPGLPTPHVDSTRGGLEGTRSTAPRSPAPVG